MSKIRAVPAASIAALLAFTVGASVGADLPGDVTAAQDRPEKARVVVEDNYFEPRSVEIVTGGEVTWRWRGENRHSIRFTKVPPRTPRRGASARASGKWKRKFQKPGVYRYVCKVWSGMRGSVAVYKPPAADRVGRRD